MRHFQHNPDITRAQTPPSWLYTDQEVYTSLLERVFANSWQLAGDVSDVRVPGAVAPITLLDGSLNEPLLLVRDTDDELHCLSNVCTHRGNLVCEHAGVEKSLRCRYHGRRFALDGSFLSMPEFEDCADFPSATDNLPSLSIEALGPMLFTRIGTGPSFADWIRPVMDRIGWMDFGQLRFDPTRSRDYLVAANWALYCENYLEGFHIPFVHASLSAAVSYPDYETILFDHSSLQIGTATNGPTLDLPTTSPDHGRDIGGYYFWLFPNLMINVYPWGISVNVVKPLGVGRTRVSFLTYVGDESLLDQGVGSELDRVEREDEAIVEAVQTGVRSRLYDRGRYSPKRETGTHHFHGLLADALSG